MDMAKKILVYHLWPLAWGSLKAMTLFLSKIKALGADYVWISPITQSPRKNHGYDISDYYDIDPRFGTSEDFAEFVATAHALGLKVIMDLIIDSTSVEHRWFYSDRGKYIWDTSAPDWQNFYDHGPAWQLDENTGKYYVHLGHPAQADLDWFPSGMLNRSLIEYFRNVMSYWLYQRDIDGFRLSNVQFINKATLRSAFKFEDILIGNKAVSVINELSNTYGKKTPFLIIDVMDRTGEAMDFYSRETDVEYITSKMLRKSLVSGCSVEDFKEKVNRLSSDNHKFMLELESHESPRITSRSGLGGKEVIDLMFGSTAHAICLHQGQELGLKNPTPAQLPIVELLNLDAKAALQFERNHSSAEALRQNSWANTRLPLPLAEYARQENDSDSVLNYAKNSISRWKCQ